MTVKVFAPAKINLTLHVTGQRDDGFHLLDSLVVFADIGDYVTVADGRGLTLTITGPEAVGVPVKGNSILKAARFMACDDLSFNLEKNLPTAAGIGGGTADAAAALRGIAQMRGLKIPQDVASLGADVPVCMQGRATRMSGIGDLLQDVPDLPNIWAVLVNPRVAVATPAVFSALKWRDNLAMPVTIPEFSTAREMTDWLAQQRNDLQSPAIKVQPVIREVLARLRATQGQMLVRMSGSGATCFALFDNAGAAGAAARDIATKRLGWWVKSTVLS
ncbi:4-diphosphocytidyl-2C-methyl-D-erythritol kinase [Marinosulfonomonas sp. PRT-SC04]|nr:4-diphosphocytidyl-2C-methyl-D-erythritol kinase [Marinosulfonomonas sp. PRT-SC04]